MLFFAALFVMASYAADRSPPVTRMEPAGYSQCFGTMMGHPEGSPYELRFCQFGNGTYVDNNAVQDRILAKDWFPQKKFKNLVGEVRIVCGPDMSDGLVFPAAEEMGMRVRVELTCDKNGSKALDGILRARKALEQVMSSREKAAREALDGVGGCKAAPASPDCRRVEKLIRDVLAGMGQVAVSGRPFQFKLAGFVVRSGLRDAVQSPTIVGMPAARQLDVLLESRLKLNADDWAQAVEKAFRELTNAEQSNLIETMIHHSDPGVRAEGFTLAQDFSTDKAREFYNLGLDDSDEHVRSVVAQHAVKHGPFLINRALADSSALVRGTALYAIVDYFERVHQPESAIPYVERLTHDADADVSRRAHALLRKLKK